MCEILGSSRSLLIQANSEKWYILNIIGMAVYLDKRPHFILGNPNYIEIEKIQPSPKICTTENCHSPIIMPHIDGELAKATYYAEWDLSQIHNEVITRNEWYSARYSIFSINASKLAEGEFIESGYKYRVSTSFNEVSKNNTLIQITKKVP